MEDQSESNASNFDLVEVVAEQYAPHADDALKKQEKEKTKGDTVINKATAMTDTKPKSTATTLAEHTAIKQQQRSYLSYALNPKTDAPASSSSPDDEDAPPDPTRLHRGNLTVGVGQPLSAVGAVRVSGSSELLPPIAISSSGNSGSSTSSQAGPEEEPTILSAVRVDDQDVEREARNRILAEAQEATVVTSSGDDTKQNKNCLLAVVVLAVLVLVVVVGLVLGLRGKGEGESTAAVSNSNNDTTIAPSNPNLKYPVRTLDKIRQRGSLRCDAINFLPGWGYQDSETNATSGFNIELCRAISAAVFDGDGDRLDWFDARELERDNSLGSKFFYLVDGSYDVMMQLITATMERDVYEGVAFSTPVFYSGLAFGGLPQYVEQCAENLDVSTGICTNLTIGVIAGSSHEPIIKGLFPIRRVKAVTSTVALFEMFAKGECNVIVNEPVGLVFLPIILQYQGEWHIGQKIFSNEPHAVVTRDGDPEWSALVDAVVQVLYMAEAQNITQEDVLSNNPNVEEYLGSTSSVDNDNADLFRNVVGATGNYGEIYASTVEPFMPREGLNRVNQDGSGMMYSFPFGEIGKAGPGPLVGGVIERILQRNLLLCGLAPHEAHFAEQQDTEGQWQGMDVEFCRGIGAALGVEVEYSDLSASDPYEALSSDRIDILAGGQVSLSKMTSGYTFSPIYYYSNDNTTAVALVTRQDDQQWGDFVRWIVHFLVHAEEFEVVSDVSPLVNVFGLELNYAFRDCLFEVGNYGGIYERTLEQKIPRSGRNLLNVNLDNPQQYAIAMS